MQYLSTGEMRPLAAEFFKDVPKLPSGELDQRCRELREAIQKASDAVQPDRTKQGPVFILGEVVEIRGGKFQVTKIEPGHLRLKSLPS
jgi:hypothetical protein